MESISFDSSVKDPDMNSAVNDGSGNNTPDYGTGRRTFNLDTIKIVAIITMVIDHLAHNILYINGFMFRFPALVPLYYVMRFIGRISFPLFSFCLIQGYIYTRNFNRYLLRLTILAVVSIIPYNLCAFGTPFEFNAVTSVLLFVIALIILKFSDRVTERFGKRSAAAVLLSLAVTAAGCFLAQVLKIDYGAFGLLFILCLYWFRNDFPSMLVIAGICIYISEGFAFSGIGAWIAFFFMYRYNGEKGKNFGYMPYVFYPVHMLVIAGIGAALHTLI